ncbi:laminin subunit alpha-3 isoform X2 [Xiphias gladius]|uniref:laminin subunit alpha-3 isoform X2 n=1 Tax=Xiphias gladius TaxID=8245 RepID=UPI001A98F601|nr:laminin subunit alpha-3 isoform X2 [Xiphias gladius]
MHWKGSWLFGVVWLVLLCFALVCPSAPKHDRHTRIHEKTHNTKKLCDPSFINQAAAAVTQKCGSGFYREWTRPYRGQCVPCSCNGLSNECDEHTGNCVNCQFNTTGDRCERCKEGYYGNPANRTCRACPCPYTWNNFALACLDIGSGEVDCLCKRGYSGARCERCAHGYYGNPVVHGGSCKPCIWGDGILNNCGSLTGDSDSCTYALLVDLEKMDDGMAWLKQQLQNISLGPGSRSRLNNLEANISETKILVESYSAAVRHLDPKVEQLEADVNVVGDNLSQLSDETLQTESDLEKVLQNVNGGKLKAVDLLSEAESLLTAIPDLITQLSEMKPGGSIPLSENSKVRMMEAAQHIVQEMSERGCSARRPNAEGSEQEEANDLLNLIRDNMTVPLETIQAVPSQTADPLMVSDSSLRELAELLSEAEDRVDRTQGLNLKSHATLQHLQMETEQSALLPVTEMTSNLLKNTTDISLMLEEFENHAAQLDGGRRELSKKSNNIFQTMAKVDTVTKAEEHAEQLSRVAAEIQQVVHNTTSGTELLSMLGIGDYNSIINAIEKAEMAANQSREAADEALKEGSLVNRAEGLRDNSTNLRTEATNRQSDLKMLSHTVNTHKDRVKKQKKKGESLRMGISTIRDDLKTIRRGGRKVLIESAKTAASASNSTVRNITERLRNISREVERITLTNVSVNLDNMLSDAEQALKNLNKALPVLTDNLAQVEALSRKVPPSANMTEGIRRIKDVIEETRNFVNRLSIATTFNGKGHVELRPPRNLEDIKTFTAVDLLLNHHKSNPSQANHRRRRQQVKHRHAKLFVFYLGNKDASGDYIGMAIKNNVLICVYKLGGVVHEVETSQITTTTDVNSSNFDRVIFHRVYQDAEINITRSFTSQKPISLSPNNNRPNTMTGVLDLDPDSVVVYVGGYPDNFTPPVELRYPKYRGAMKLSYINDNPVCLFNYKHAVNMDAKQPLIKIFHSEVCDYYDGTGYRMAFIKVPDEKKRRLYKFGTKSRETDALLFYIGNQESFFCVFVERGYLMLQGQQAGRELRAQSAEKVSLFQQTFAITTADRITVHYGPQQISIDHIHTDYMTYYVGGLPAQLRQRHNITAPPLRGCVDQLRVDGEIVEYNRTMGVSHGCPVSLLGVRAATLYSALPIDSLFVPDELPVRVSLGFRTTVRHGAFLRSSSQGSTSAHGLQLSLADGYIVFNSNNYTLKSDKRYSDGSWHYLSAVRRPTGLELNIDNVNVIQGHSHHIRPVDQNSQGEKFKGYIANLYTRRPEQSFIPADLSSFSQTGDIFPGLGSLQSPPHTELLPAPMLKKRPKHEPIQAPAGTQCKHRQAHRGEYQLYDEHSWLSYTLPQQDLNHRPHFSLDVKTKSSKGLILHVAGRGVVPLLALYMANGKIKMSLGQNRIIQHQRRSNDGNWHRVQFSVENSTFHLLVDEIRVTDGHLPNNEGSSLDLHNPVYLGGDPKSGTIKGHNIPMKSVTGCIRDFKMNEVAVGEPEASHKTLPCSSGLTEIGTYFGGGHIVLDNYFTVGSHFVLSFELRPQYLTGLLFHARSAKASLNVFLRENKVGVEVSEGNGAVSLSVTPRESLCDGKFHVVTVSEQHEVLKLVVDSMSEQKAVPFTSMSHSRLVSFFIGGTIEYSQVPVSTPFVGCLRNVKVNGRPVAFETESRVVDSVSINRCPED